MPPQQVQEASRVDTPRAQYRSDIDGLRAIAIILVVGFHVGLPGFEGGFVGVDVFFVVSGFLITQLLLRELGEHGRISYVDFYVRRIRRLLPALAVVVVFTLVGSALVLMPWELVNAGKSAVATGGFASNIYFWHETGGYFGVAAETQPLLHTWSLAVEEQFYFVWPALIGLAYAFGRRRSPTRVVAAVLAATCLASFGLSLVMTDRAPLAAFFLMPPRLWELGVGGLLALAAPRLLARGGRLGAWWVGLGVGVIVLAGVLISPADRWPGLLVTIPVVATLAVIAGGTTSSEPSSATRLLSLGPLVAVGRLSYSWYLWHWPMLTLVRDATLEQDVARDTVIALLALGIAAVSYHFVEQPVRRQHIAVTRTPMRTIAFGVALVVVMVGTGFLAVRIAHQRERSDEFAPYVAAMAHRDPCAGDGFNCVGPADPDAGYVALFGDSHAGSWAQTFADASRERGTGLRLQTWGGCPFIEDVELWDPLLQQVDQACAQRVDGWMDEILDPQNDVRTVVIANYSVPGRRIADPTGDTSLVRNGEQLTMSDAIDTWEAGMRATVKRITESGRRVIIVQSVPGVERPAPECVPRFGIRSCSTDRATVDRYREPVMAAERRAIEGDPLARVWDPESQFCTRVRCLPERDGVVFYSDTNHLSATKATALVPIVTQLLADTSGQGPPG